jgi:hypothetical protein
MATTLRSTIHDLAAAFAEQLLEAVRGASLQDILGQPGKGPAAAKSRGVVNGAATAEAAPARGRKKAGRLARRSPEEIKELIGQIVELLKKNPEGLRAEEIKQKLGLQAKEMPRPLADGVASRQLKKKGEKRATTYFAK